MINPLVKIVELFVDEEHDAILQSISIVDKPAIEREFMYFSEEGRKLLYFQEDGDQRIVVSPAMIPDKMIPRKDEDGSVYYVFFSKETIAKAAEYLMKYNKQSHSNINHQRVYSDDMYVMESWIKESTNDKSTDYGFEDLPLGTWFVKFRILNDEAWAKIKSGELRGLSVEGDFLLGTEKYMSNQFSRFKTRYSVVRNKYKRVYKGLSDEEKNTMDELLFLVEMAANDVFDKPEDAVQRSKQLGLNGEIHSFLDPETKTIMYMPGKNMAEYESVAMAANPIDIVSMDVPLFQRLLEVSRENGISDIDLHKLVENATALASKGTPLTVDDYDAVISGMVDVQMNIDVAGLPGYVDQGEKKKQKFAETYTDYPDGAVNNAKRALEWADKNGWGSCGMGAGKARANQLANREPISEDTIARMSAFERHRQNSDTPYSEGCGKLMWDAWGGDAGVRWAHNKLREIRGEKMSSLLQFDKISFDYDGTLSTAKGFELAKGYVNDGDTLYIISARNEVSPEMLNKAKELGIPESRVFATGSNKAKVEKIKELGMVKHIDNNSDIISELPGIGIAFMDPEDSLATEGFANPADIKVGDAVSWQTSGSNPRGRVRDIVREGSKKVPGADFEISGTADNPGYLIELYEQDAEGKWKATGTMVGRKADSILKNVELKAEDFAKYYSPVQKQTIGDFLQDVKQVYGI